MEYNASGKGIRERIAMKTGRLQETIYNRSIIKELDNNLDGTFLRAGAGAKSILLRLGCVENMIVSSVSIGYARKNLGRLGVTAALNRMAAQGGKALGLFIQLWLPENYTERKLKLLVRQAKETADKFQVPVYDVQAEVNPDAIRPFLCVTILGDQVIEFSGLKPGHDIVAIGHIGLEGTAILSREKEENLKNRFTEEFLQKAKDTLEELTMVKEAAAAVQSGTVVLKDVSEGGIFGALWELAQESSVGLEMNLRSIPVRQETIEVCEALHCNPYELVSGGCLLAACPNGNDMVRHLTAAGLSGAVIGKATSGNDRVIWNMDEKRYMEPGKSDEIYHALKMEG